MNTKIALVDINGLIGRGCTAIALLLAVTSVGAQEVRNISFGGSVSGQFVGDFYSSESKIQQFAGIPKVDVSLIQVRSGKLVRSMNSDSNGRFEFARLGAGKYMVCWKRKYFTESCSKAFSLRNSHVDLKQQTLTNGQIDITQLQPGQMDLELSDYLRDLLRSRQNVCLDGAGNDRFLTRMKNDQDPESARAEQIGEAYYAKIDPNNLRLTLSDWWRVNGFDPITGRAPAENNGYKAAAIAYLNDNDLGFGRNMHCLKKNNTAIACWVANHGQGDQNVANADLAANYEDPGPTVTMEYSSFGGFLLAKPFDFSRFSKISDVELKPSDKLMVERDFAELKQFNKRELSDRTLIATLLGSPTVKFYVYAPDDNLPNQAHGEFARTTRADLDGCGVKHTPGLCLNCHGGKVPNEIVNGDRDDWTVADVREVGSASFREFDTATFKYPGGRTSPNNVEHATFKRLNKLVQATNPNDTIDNLINEWYDNSSDITIDEDYVPPSWQGQHEDAYKEGIAKGCRTCHVALDDAYNWEDRDNLLGYNLESYLCGSQGAMPHAKITDGNLTTSQRDTLLADFQQACSP